MDKNIHKYFIIYILLMIGMGSWQLIDWYFIDGDPLWHILFYILFIPVISFIFSIKVSNIKKYYTIPIFTLFMTSIIYLLMSNGGITIDIWALYFGIISFIVSIIGIIIGKIIIKFNKN